MTVVELMIGLAVGLLVLAATCAFSLFSGRSFVTLLGEATLNKQNRYALDLMTRDLRGSAGISDYNSPQDVTFADWDNSSMRYFYDATNKTLSRVKSGVTNVLLKDCSRFAFDFNMRNMTNSTFWCYATTNVMEAKALTVNWCCTRTVLGRTSDGMPQYSTIVMRSKN
jgi:Tfp pilus assembly protein PilW